ncbi:hypothetical protein RFI_09927 [Reticulomyxa filosa]|uniref:NACHT domain-containing protein n=1 Tax=Reticulomyxa filosa TaxID=46433 RepID=X6NPA4_RETFI|nr:hypothetical protein RFI_09927 [Reticulomyxa filosa]|eukprot:ETO27202.1 hypothetical protein RFI_09927 [Reticulomyxa filosa]
MTMKTVKKILSASTKIIHFSGYGVPNALAFENEEQFGIVQKLPFTQLDDRFFSLDKSLTLELIFISTSHSLANGQAFVQAGAKHVVCISPDDPILDKSVHVFIYQFYFNIVAGKTIQEAFDIGRQVLKTDFGNEKMGEKCWLLPEEKVHNVVLFPQTLTGNLNKCVPQTTTTTTTTTTIEWNKPHLRREDSLNVSTSMTINANDNDTCNGGKVSKLIDCSKKKGTHSFDRPSDLWIGRQVEMFELLESICDGLSKKKKCSVVMGEKGMGKSALVNQVFEYVWERRMFEGIVLIDVFKLWQEKKSQSIAEVISDQLREANMKISKCYTNKELVRELKGRRILLGIENIDSYYVPYSGQRMDECLYRLWQQKTISIVVTTSTNHFQKRYEYMPMLQLIPQRVIVLKPLSDSQMAQIFTLQIQKTHHKPILQQMGNDKIEKLARDCKGVPELVHYALFVCTQKDIAVDRYKVTNFTRVLIDNVAEYRQSLDKWQYFVPLHDIRPLLTPQQLQHKIQDKHAREFWVKKFQYNPIGDWPTIATFIQTKYKQRVGHKYYKLRPLDILSPLSLDFQFFVQDLFPDFAEEARVNFSSFLHHHHHHHHHHLSASSKENKEPKKTKGFLDWLKPTKPHASNQHIDTTDNHEDSNSKNEISTTYDRSSILNLPDTNDLKTCTDVDQKHTNDIIDNSHHFLRDSIAVEIFGLFIDYFNNLLDCILLPEIAPFYFRNDLTLIAGMIPIAKAFDYLCDKVSLHIYIYINNTLFFFFFINLLTLFCRFKETELEYQTWHFGSSLVLMFTQKMEHKEYLQIEQRKIQIHKQQGKAFFELINPDCDVPRSSLYDIVQDVEELQFLLHFKNNTTVDLIPRQQILELFGSYQ